MTSNVLQQDDIYITRCHLAVSNINIRTALCKKKSTLHDGCFYCMVGNVLLTNLKKKDLLRRTGLGRLTPKLIHFTHLYVAFVDCPCILQRLSLPFL